VGVVKSRLNQEIWFLSTVKLLRDEGEKAIESMTPMPKFPMIGAN
jgi:hypothetical protein